MALLKNTTLPGSTVIEVIVASVLFLIVFFLATEMLVRIGSRQPDDALLRMELDHKACVREFKTGSFEPGEHVREYDWGEITVTVKAYRNLTDIQELLFITRIEKARRTFTYRILKTVGP